MRWRLLVWFSFLTLGGCECVDEHSYSGWNVEILDGGESPEDRAWSRAGEVTVRLADMEYNFRDAIHVARGTAPASDPFSVRITRRPRNGTVDLYEDCTVQLDEAPVSEIEFSSDNEPFRFRIQVSGQEMRELCLEYWELAAQEPDTNVDETWDDWIDLVPFNDVNLHLEAEYFAFTEYEECQ